MNKTILMAHPSPDLYGSDRVFIETASGFVNAGYRVVAALPHGGPLVEVLRERGVEIELLPFPVLRKSYLSPLGLVRLAGQVLRSLPRMLKLIRRVQPATVLVNTLTIPVWVLANRLSRVPVVCHVHEAEQSASSFVKRALNFPLLLCRGLVVNSRFSLDVLTESWSRLGGRATIVYNGVPGPPEVVPARQTLVDPVHLLFLGRLSPRKGPHVAVEAVAQLIKAGSDVRLKLLGAVFPGYEWFEEELREKVLGDGLDPVVEFLGFDPDIWGHLARADIVIVPSTVDEPFGNTAVEAILAGRPLVVSATSGLLEAAEGYETARRVPPGDPAALMEAVLDLTSDWTRVVAASEDDRVAAQGKHAPEVYQREVVSAVKALLDDRRDAAESSS